MIIKWNVYCETEETDVTTWASTAPTQCPNDAGHTIGGDVYAVTEDGDVAKAKPHVYLYSPDNTVWKLKVDNTGTVSTESV